MTIHCYTVISTPHRLLVPDLIPVSELFLPMEIQPKMDAGSVHAEEYVMRNMYKLSVH